MYELHTRRLKNITHMKKFLIGITIHNNAPYGVKSKVIGVNILS